MYQDINTLKQRIAAINQLRLARAMSSMPLINQQVFLALTLLLHHHSAVLPGYCREWVPFGIQDFCVDKIQLDALNQLLGIELTEEFLPERDTQLPIMGVYSMGSTSSIAQSRHSDLDIWVCHQSDLLAQELQALHDKCRALEQWAAQYGVDVNLFLMDENYFRYPKVGGVTGDNCGSTQHILLLDEFYRTAVRLAGKPLLWNMVPVEQEENYHEYLLSLYAKGIVVAEEWLDFGGLNGLSAEEYFGASLWQLYKSIDAPHKSVLKALLLEAYSWEYPRTQLLSLTIKQAIHQGEVDIQNLDPYLMMLDKVSQYLKAIGDHQRLDLARCCFYLKTSECLADQNGGDGSHRSVLTQLVNEWGWDKARLNLLECHPEWKIEQVKEAHNQLLDLLMYSYRNLIRFARQNQLTIRATPKDIGVLARKLYAAFEVLPGKITLLNPQMYYDLSEPHLTFIHVSSPLSVNRPGWYVYHKAPTVAEITGQQPLEYNGYLTKLVAWSYFNGLLTWQTTLHVFHFSTTLHDKLLQFVRDIRLSFPIKIASPTPAALYSPCEMKQLAIILNFEQDPTEGLDELGCDLSIDGINIFSYGFPACSLVGSVDLLYRNSWNEIRTLHYQGEQSILDAVKMILSKIHQTAATPDAIQVFCYSRHLSDVVRTSVENFITECIALRLSSRKAESGRFKTVYLAGQTWGLFFERLGVSAQKLENAVEFYGSISNNKLYRLPKQAGAEQMELPAIIDGVASEGIMQFFFEDHQYGFTLYILDEWNRVEIYQRCSGSKKELVRAISRFYSASDENANQGSTVINFNLPQFYQITQQAERVVIIPFPSDTIPESLI